MKKIYYFITLLVFFSCSNADMVSKEDETNSKIAEVEKPVQEPEPKKDNLTDPVSLYDGFLNKFESIELPFNSDSIELKQAFEQQEVSTFIDTLYDNHVKEQEELSEEEYYGVKNYYAIGKHSVSDSVNLLIYGSRWMSPEDLELALFNNKGRKLDKLKMDLSEVFNKNMFLVINSNKKIEINREEGISETYIISDSSFINPEL